MTSTDASSHRATRPTDAQFRHLTFHSILAGLTPLIPVPFLDDRIHDAVKRRMVQEIVRGVGVSLDDRARDVLAGVESGESRGCAGWALWAIKRSFFLLLKLIRKLYRKVLIFLAVQQGVDTASRAFHEGYLLHVGLARHEGDRLDEAAARALRSRVDRVLERVDPRPIHQAISTIFRGSKDLLKTASQLLSRPFRDRETARRAAPEAVPTEAEKELLSGMTGRLADSLQGERGYLDRLEAELGKTTAT